MPSRGPRHRPDDEGRLIQLVYYAYLGLSRLALALPERVAYGLAHAAGGVAARISKKRGTVAQNIARIAGAEGGHDEIGDLVVAAYRSYARYWLETFRLVREGPEYFLDRFRATGEENLDAALARGKGVVVVVGHLGNWDAGGAWVGARGNRLVTVAEVLRPRRMFDFFAAHRAALGMTIFPAQRGAMSHLVKAAEEGAVVAILGDRDLRGRGPEVEFFGERVRMPAGPATVALRSGVPLLVAGVYSERRHGVWGWSCDISEPVEVPAAPGPDAVIELTQRVARLLEHYIALRPEEWHVFQPVWPSDRTKRARA
ncbi:MAG: phosphatidylinositol mannoside acyltransferase [Actinomycetota bacterium]